MTKRLLLHRRRVIKVNIRYNTSKNDEGNVTIEVIVDDLIVAVLKQKESNVLTLVQKVDLNTATISVILNDFVKSSYDIAVARLRFELDF